MSLESYKGIKENFENPEENISGPEKVVNMMEEYGSIENLFLMESLGENIESVRKQLGKIRELITKLKTLQEKQKIDQGISVYVDEVGLELYEAFRHFELNGKNINLYEFFEEDLEESLYNEIIFEINRYIEDYMIGTDEPQFKEI